MSFEKLLVYINANIENGMITFNQTNNYKCQPENFFCEMEDMKNMSKLDNNLELYCILGKRDVIQKIRKEIVEKINEIFNKITEENIDNVIYNIEKRAKDTSSDFEDRFIYSYINNAISDYTLKCFMPLEVEWENGVVCLALYYTDNENDDKQLEISSIVKLFLEKEKPFFMGKQIMIQSFLLQDIKERKILGVLPSNIEGMGWYALLEGGIKLYLNNDIPYIREKISGNDIGMWTPLELNSILHNPVYAYTKLFTPYEQFEEWNNIFLYALATLPIEYDSKNIELLYEEFLKYIEDNICNVETVGQAIITKDVYIQALIVSINNIRDYLQGKEEIGISKNMLLTLKSRYIYLPQIYSIIQKYYPKQVIERNNCIEFSKNEFKLILDKIDKGNNYEKGICLEEVADYFINCISGLKITKKRAKTENEEIDLLCCNMSEEQKLWELGAVILIECKNWKDKVDTKVIRNLSYIMEKKGISTLCLFTKNGITQGAEIEVIKQAARNKYILTFDLEDLRKLDENELTPKEEFLKKYENLIMITENNMELIM